MQEVRFFGSTDMGRIRTNNEDAFVVQNIWNEEHVLAVAIDGVGGYEGGEVASAMARDKIVEYLEKYPNGERLELLKQAVIYANNAIYEARKEDLTLSSMSCVLTAALVEIGEERINMAHVGDTRLYQFADGEMTKLSHDHSLVGYREEIGDLTEEEAMHHPQRNIIGKDVGSTLLEDDGGDYVETATFPIMRRSTLLLCSDGLCDMITSRQMAEVLATDEDVEQKTLQLIAAANEAGGKDNVTVVLVDIALPDDELKPIVEVEDVESGDEQSDGEQQTIESQREQRGKRWVVWVVVIIVALVMFVAGFFLSNAIQGKDKSPEKPPVESTTTAPLVVGEPVIDTLERVDGEEMINAEDGVTVEDEQ